jgi:hypothetical protein
MGAYSVGSVNVRIGSATVTGNGTRFDLYVSDGDIFKLNESSTFYDIADVVGSLSLTLSSRYADSSRETHRASEHCGTITTATKTYTHTAANTPVIVSSLTVVASVVTWTDNGAGVLATTSGAGVGAAGTIDYDSGLITVNLNATVGMIDKAVTATYHSGDYIQSMPYQVITDYTPYCNLPEVGNTDANTPYIVTKALRRIDAKMYNASMNNASITRVRVRTGGHVKLGSHQYLFFGTANLATSVVKAATAVDASCKGSLYMSSAPNLWFLDSDTTATIK